ncbi:MAG: glycosyltransferase, partial [Phascolarctobacterium sp.]|nr:glycosyltransferase [Candidatus Phascolarctobacterium caballi]
MEFECKVSVLVTFYNQEKYVDRALQSILAQKVNFEYKIFIGDDGSCDGTLDRVKVWQKQYPNKIIVSVMSRKKGVKYIGGFRASQNRLSLLKYVNSEYFIFLDGDDFFTDNNKLQKQVDVLDLEDNSDCVACGHHVSMLYLNGDKKHITDDNIKTGKYAPKEYWGRPMYFHPDSMLTRSFVISSFPFDLVENSFNDNLITFLTIQKGKLYFLEDDMAVYSITEDGIWTSNNIIVNLIRSIIGYDLCNLINLKMKKETDKRNRGVWFDLIECREKINKGELFLLEE